MSARAGQRFADVARLVEASRLRQERALAAMPRPYTAIEQSGPFAGRNVGRVWGPAVWYDSRNARVPLLVMPTPERAEKVAAGLSRLVSAGTARDAVDRLARVQRRALGLCEDCGAESRFGCCD